MLKAEIRIGRFRFAILFILLILSKSGFPVGRPDEPRQPELGFHGISNLKFAIRRLRRWFFVDCMWTLVGRRATPAGCEWGQVAPAVPGFHGISNLEFET
jgi:hypothetical protein